MNATVRWTMIVVAFLVSNALAMGYLVLASSTSRAVDAQAGVSLDLRDAAGTPIIGARVHVSAMARATGRRTELDLVERDGRYVATHRAGGLEDLAIVAERGGERFTAHAIVE